MTFSIIIINYKTPRLTIDCIRSLFALPEAKNREIIVIDNASEDGSVEILKDEFGAKIQIIANKKNLGFSAANNQGAALSTGDFLLFLNSDTIVNKDIFKKCLDLFKADDKIGIISPRLKLESGESQKNAFGYFPTFWGLITQAGKKEIIIPEVSQKFEVDWVSGCALMIRRDIFQKIGGWDDHFFLYFEDVDICRLVKKNGYKIVVNLESEITHLGGKSLAINSERKKYYYEAQNYYFKKNYGVIIEWLIKITRIVFKIIKK